MEVTFVILNWNKSEMTIQTIKNIENIENKSFGIIVVDNGSNTVERDKLVEFAKSAGWDIVSETGGAAISNQRVLLLAERNYGYAKGNNLGLKLAKSIGYQWAVVMNNDVIVEQPVVDTLLEIGKADQKIAIVGPKVLDLEGKRQGPFRREGLYTYFFYQIFFPILYPFKKVMIKLNEKKLSNGSLVFTYYVMGCFMLVNLAIMEELGWFDEHTFLYAEELILAEKIRQRRYKVAYTEKTYVKHIHGASTSEIKDQRASMKLSSVLYYFKNYRGYGKIKLALVKAGFYWSNFVINPLVINIRKIMKSTIC
ncbi:MAG TPA: glycosyltransferase [Fervidobacterium sp.]|nr:glycosyltransferase [Fervidobacterium sp.]